MRANVLKSIMISVVLIMTLVLAACGSPNASVENTPTPESTTAPGAAETASPIAEPKREINLDGSVVSAGEIISSGETRNKTISIDSDSIITLDPHTSIVFDGISENSLTLTLLAGTIYAEIAQRRENDEYLVKAGDSILRVIGTTFIAGFGADENPVFVMLDGNGEVDGTLLSDGNAAITGEDGLVVEPFDVSNDFIIRFGDHSWRVLDQQDGKAFVISEFRALSQAYHADGGDITWEHSSLRSYLNGEFFSSISPADQERIIETILDNKDNPSSGTPGGNDTTDRIFLPSIDDAERYLRLFDNSIATWLRAPGNSSSKAAMIGYGDIYYSGNPVEGVMPIYPAMWVELLYSDYIEFVSGSGGDDYTNLPEIIPAPTPPPLAEADFVVIDLNDRGITNAELADMVTSGQIPANVTHLYLDSNKINDISPISELTNLRMLYLNWNPFDGDITPLSKLTNLTELSISGSQTPIRDLSPISGLTNLEVLNVSNHSISSIAPLRGMINLRYLWIAGNQISDISLLAGLRNLNNLGIGGNQISDLSPLSSMTGMFSLNLSNNQISDLSPLSSLTNLGVLTLSGNRLSDISPLSELTSVYWLVLSQNQISDVTPLSGLTGLTHINLEDNIVSDVTALFGLTGLDSVHVRRNSLTREQMEELQKVLPRTLVVMQ